MTSLPRLLLLTDRSRLRPGRQLIRTLEVAVAAGATHVVIRELDEVESCRQALVDAVVRAGGTAIAAHRPLPGASGVHLPAHAPPVPGIFGRSCHSRADVEDAVRQGAAWATLSPFASSSSKPGYGPPRPRSEYAGHPVPVFALGGITPGNARQAIDAGAHGVAVMGAVMRASDPAGVVREILEAVA